MSKMSPDERKKRRDAVADEALDSVAKSEQFNFRVDAETIKRLYKIAGEQRKPVGALVREWVQDRLDAQQNAPTSNELLNEIRAFRQETARNLHDLQHQVAIKQELGGMQKSIADSSPARHHKTTESYSQGSSGEMHLAESVSPSNSFVPLTRTISKRELLDELDHLRLKTTGYYEVPEWIIEYIKNELRA